MNPQSRNSAGLIGRLDRWWSGQDVHILDLLRGASVAGALKALAAILAFGLSVVLGRVLGAEATGVYFLAVTTATIAATLGRFGLDSAVLRLIAAHTVVDRWAGVMQVHRAALWIGFVCSSTVAVGLYLCAEFLAVSIFSDLNLAIPIRLVALAVMPLAMSTLIARELQGLARIRDSLLVLSIIPTAIALAGAWVLGVKWGVHGALAAYVVAMTFALVYGWTIWKRALSGRGSGPVLSQKVAHSVRDLLRIGVPLLIGAILQLVIQASGTVFLGVWSDTAEVGLYAVAWRTAVLITFVLVAVNAIAQPKFAKLYASGDMESLASTAYKATLLMTACSLPVLLVFLISPSFVLNAFGDDFSEGATSLRVLSIGQFVNVATGSVGVLLVMSGREQEYRNVQIIAAILALALGIILIPTYGAVGAALAAAAALIVQNVLFGYFVWARLGILTFVPTVVANRKGGST